MKETRSVRAVFPPMCMLRRSCMSPSPLSSIIVLFEIYPCNLHYKRALIALCAVPLLIFLRDMQSVWQWRRLLLDFAPSTRLRSFYWTSLLLVDFAPSWRLPSFSKTSLLLLDFDPSCRLRSFSSTSLLLEDFAPSRRLRSFSKNSLLFVNFDPILVYSLGIYFVCSRIHLHHFLQYIG